MKNCFLSKAIFVLLSLMTVVLPLSGCGAAATVSAVGETKTIVLSTATLQPAETAALPTATPPQPAPTLGKVEPVLWISPDLPEAFRSQLKLPPALKVVTERESANLWLEVNLPDTSQPDWKALEVGRTSWWYVVAAPFPSTPDEAWLGPIQSAWDGTFKDFLDEAYPFGKQPLLMSEETHAMFVNIWGPSGATGVRIVPRDQLLDTAWKEKPNWAIIPFEDIAPRWKVLRLNNADIFDKNFNPIRYRLLVPIALHGTEAAVHSLNASIDLPTNFDPNKLTTVTMTGVTALSRQIAESMEKNGAIYPATGIDRWLIDSDITHISNEVSFYQDCPKPGPNRRDMRFCSNPEYIKLLEYVGTDIVELTGNHLFDWGTQPFLDTLAMYRACGWQWYGGGANLAEAVRPLLIEDHGNKLAFLGCSPAGPESVWAAKDKPGSAPCNLDKMEQAVRDLRAQGYLPIVTFQHHETDGYVPSPAGGGPDFRRMAQAGAVVVSGSQSHYAQTMTFVNGNFVHYGLGNLFFDQMQPAEIRNLFVDRHVFYDGKYLGVQLLTAILEDASRPRPMTVEERQAFLEKLFSLSVWENK